MPDVASWLLGRHTAIARFGTDQFTGNVIFAVFFVLSIGLYCGFQSVPVTNKATNWYHPPLKGTLHITSSFGKRRNSFGKKKSEHHNGLDLSAKAGTPIYVYAMLPGEVAHIGYDPRSGNYIKLRHGNFTVSYCHLIRKPNIPVGSKVLPGQPVAHVGSTGRSTGPHLHITLKRNGRVIDPAILLIES